jgi:hypothetical protein
VNLINVSKKFGTEEAALDFLEAMRWPEDVTCMECKGKHISKFTAKGATRTRISKKTGQIKTTTSRTRYLYECLDPKCGHQFTATTGTIFHDTHLPLEKWLMAVALMVNAKKGLSAKQMQRDLEVSYQTAWYLCHRIRKAMTEGPGALFKGIVEVDETYVGGRYDKRRNRQRWDKEAVFGIVERGGKVRTWHMPNMSRYHAVRKMNETISPEAELLATDDGKFYKRMPVNLRGVTHEIVNHSGKEWVRGNVHTGTIDGYWGLLKRGIIGSFHQISITHLHRYLSEFEFRWNHRDAEDMFAMVIANLVIGTHMEYKELTGKKAAKPVSEPLDDSDERF